MFALGRHATSPWRAATRFRKKECFDKGKLRQSGWNEIPRKVRTVTSSGSAGHGPLGRFPYPLNPGME
jgi:hypothetical protein